MPDMNKILINELEKHGYSVKLTSVSHIFELKEEIASLKNRSLFDVEFYNENIEWMDFDYLNIMPEAKSILVITHPQFITRLKLEYKGKSHIAIIPPTYIYGNMFEDVMNVVNQVLTPYKYSISRTKLPAKLLAVRTGLAEYGKNNISYINGMGSFHRLFTFFTDMPYEEDSWRETTVMPECSSCNACTKACPTNAIDSDRYLIHGEKCITYFNESPGEFPEWIDKSWHNAVVGCMKCQMACPKNREVTDKVELEVVLEEEEVKAILQKTPLEQLPEHLVKKLERLNLLDYYDVLGRNISVLIS